MWPFKRQTKAKTDAQLEAIHADTFSKIDRATKSIDRNTASLEKLNKLLEKRGDTAYNVFNATGGLRRNKK